MKVAMLYANFTAITKFSVHDCNRFGSCLLPQWPLLHHCCYSVTFFYFFGSDRFWTSPWRGERYDVSLWFRASASRSRWKLDAFFGGWGGGKSWPNSQWGICLLWQMGRSPLGTHEWALVVVLVFNCREVAAILTNRAKWVAWLDKHPQEMQGGRREARPHERKAFFLVTTKGYCEARTHVCALKNFWVF